MQQSMRFCKCGIGLIKTLKYTDKWKNQRNKSGCNDL